VETAKGWLKTKLQVDSCAKITEKQWRGIVSEDGFAKVRKAVDDMIGGDADD